MQRKPKIAICALLLLITPISLVSLSISNNFIFSREGTVKELEFTPPRLGTDRHYDLFDDDILFGRLDIQVQQPVYSGEVIKIRFSAQKGSSDSKFVVDSIVVKLVGLGSPNDVYINCNYPTFPSSSHGDAHQTTMRWDGMEKYRGFDAPITFMVQSIRNFTMMTEVTYHEASLLQLTCLKAHTQTTIQFQKT
jgi:hypothetical protein